MFLQANFFKCGTIDVEENGIKAIMEPRQLSGRKMSVNSRSPENDSAANRIALWLDLMRTTEKLLLAGLRRRIGQDGDIREAYRQWYAGQMREHDEIIERIAARLAAGSQESCHGR
jgi:hypothetical protein